MDFTPTGQHYAVKDVTLLDEDTNTYTAVVVMPSQHIKSAFWSDTTVVLDTHPQWIADNLFIAHANDIIAFKQK